MMRLSDEQRQLASENEGLIWGFLAKNGLDENYTDDLYGLLAEAYCKACKDYNPSKGKLSTLAYKYMRNQLSSWKRDTQYHKRLINNCCTSLQNPMDDDDEITLEDTLEDDSDFTASIDGRVDAINIISMAWDLCSDNQRELITMLYQDLIYEGECCYRAIGAKLGISGQAVKDRKDSVKRIIESEVFAQ